MSETTSKPHVAEAMRGKGKISQIIGAVVNVKFDSQEDLPEIYEALVVENSKNSSIGVGSSSIESSVDIGHSAENRKTKNLSSDDQRITKNKNQIIKEV